MQKTLFTAFLILCFQAAFSQVTLLSNNTSLHEGVVVNGKGLLVSKSDSLWVTDGTPAGTTRLTTVVSVDTSGQNAAILGTKILFAGVNSTNGVELWVSDGTSGGTTLVKDINPGTNSSGPANFTIYNNTVYFTADNGTQGLELWKSDGSTAGTVPVKDINPAGSAFSTDDDPMFTINNGILYFIADNGANGTELWRTDGTSGGTSIVSDITAGSTGTTFTSINNLGTNLILGVQAGNIFASVFQLWKSDGTNPGTSLVKDFGSFSGLFTPTMFAFNNKLYFNGTDFATTGNELWVTDGTTPGTTLVKDINPGTSHSIPLLFNAVIINNKFYFQATNNTNGSELWMSDGTSDGTVLLKDIFPGGTGSNPIIFKSFDFSMGGFTDNTLYNGKVFFSANNGTNGTELWVTDGTDGGTVIVKDINPGSGSAITSGLSYFYTSSGLFFSANDGTSGAEPWFSDATGGGTNRIADVKPGEGSSGPVPVFLYNNQLYFNATNGDDPTLTDLFKVDAALTPLPVSLLHFSAMVQPKNAVQLDWTTANEINNDHFEIERSVDGRNFIDVMHMAAKGNGSVKQNYAYLDEQAGSLNSGVIYYRLKIMAKDGLYKYSAVLVIHLKGNPLQFTFAPNPVTDQLSVMITPSGNGKIALRITDASGKQVYQKSILSGQGAYLENIQTGRLQKGIYYLQLITDGEIKSSAFIKQ